MERVVRVQQGKVSKAEFPGRDCSLAKTGGIFPGHLTQEMIDKGSFTGRKFL